MNVHEHDGQALTSFSFYRVRVVYLRKGGIFDVQIAIVIDMVIFVFSVC